MGLFDNKVEKNNTELKDTILEHVLKNGTYYVERQIVYKDNNIIAHDKTMISILTITDSSLELKTKDLNVNNIVFSPNYFGTKQVEENLIIDFYGAKLDDGTEYSINILRNIINQTFFLHLKISGLLLSHEVKDNRKILENDEYEVNGQIVFSENEGKAVGAEDSLKSNLVIDENKYLLFQTTDLNGRVVAFLPKNYHGMTTDGIFVREHYSSIDTNGVEYKIRLVHNIEENTYYLHLLVHNLIIQHSIEI